MEFSNTHNFEQFSSSSSESENDSLPNKRRRIAYKSEGASGSREKEKGRDSSEQNKVDSTDNKYSKEYWQKRLKKYSPDKLFQPFDPKGAKLIEKEGGFEEYVKDLKPWEDRFKSLKEKHEKPTQKLKDNSNLDEVDDEFVEMGKQYIKDFRAYRGDEHELVQIQIADCKNQLLFLEDSQDSKGIFMELYNALKRYKDSLNRRKAYTSRIDELVKKENAGTELFGTKGVDENVRRIEALRSWVAEMMEKNQSLENCKTFAADFQKNQDFEYLMLTGDPSSKLPYSELQAFKRVAKRADLRSILKYINFKN